MTKRIMLTAAEGKILTNGEIYGNTIYLATDADESAFYEITEEEHNARHKETEAKAFEEMGMRAE